MAASHFFIDDLLNLSKHDTNIVPYDFLFDNSPSGGGVISISTDSSMTPAGADVQLSGGLPVPCDDLEDLDWLSDFEEDLFSMIDDVGRLFTTGPKPGPTEISQPEIPGRVAQGELELDHGHSRNRALSPKPGPIAFSKPEIPGRVAQGEPDHGHSRNRALSPKPGPIAFSEHDIPSRVAQGELEPDHGHSRNRALSPKPGPIAFSEPDIPCRVAQGEPDHGHSGKRALSPKPGPKVVGRRHCSHCTAKNTPRRCLHCSAENTPQWRTGPKGPKTLCNACGVRYKSGRLVPEYRPAASPTFVPSKHSNLHKKVLELRKKKVGHTGLLRHQEYRR